MTTEITTAIPSAHGQITSAIETITPEVAQTYLTSNTGNRPIHKRALAQYVDDIINRRWQTNGASIIFDINGTLVDGQHRLMAVVEANTPIDAVVVRGVPVGSFETIDIGKARTSRDGIAALKVAPTDFSKANVAKFNQVMAQAARLIIGYSFGTLECKDRITNIQINELVTTNRVALTRCVTAAIDNVRTTSPHVFAATMYLAHPESDWADPQATLMFDRFLADISDPKTLETSNPAKRLRAYLDSSPGRNVCIPVYIVTAWNHYNQGLPLGPLGTHKFPLDARMSTKVSHALPIDTDADRWAHSMSLTDALKTIDPDMFRTDDSVPSSADDTANAVLTASKIEGRSKGPKRSRKPKEAGPVADWSLPVSDGLPS